MKKRIKCMALDCDYFIILRVSNFDEYIFCGECHDRIYRFVDTDLYFNNKLNRDDLLKYWRERFIQPERLNPKTSKEDAIV